MGNIDEIVYTVGELRRVLSTLPKDMPLEMSVFWYNNGYLQHAHRNALKHPDGMGVFLEMTDINGQKGLCLINGGAGDMEAEL